MVTSRISDLPAPLPRAVISVDRSLRRTSRLLGLLRGSRNGQTVPHRIALVTPYPVRDQQSISGVASYSREFVRALVEFDLDLEVWAERTFPESTEPDHVPAQVIRAWRAGLWAGLDLWRMLRARRPAVVHVQIEYFIFGGWLGFISLLSFLVAARFTRTKVFATAHQVLSLAGLRRQVLREFGVRLPAHVARVLVHLSTALLGRVTDRIIVHEEVFRSRLIEEYQINPARVEIINHGVPEVPGDPPAQRSKRILLFGYLKWYKGIDIALRAFCEVATEFPDWKLIIAGGLPAGLGEGHPHIRFYNYLRALSHQLGKRVEFLGYVGDAAIPELFRQADLVLFPYRVLFSASGPLALAIGYRKAFIISEPLRPILPTWPLWCPNSPDRWAQTLRRLMGDEAVIAHAEILADLLKSTRTWPDTARQIARRYGAVESLVPVADHSP